MIELSFQEISERLKKINLPAVDLVVGIARGGTVPAALTAFSLNCGLAIIHFSYRDENNNPRYPEPRLMAKYQIHSGVRSILLVDDISVSGKTLTMARELLKNYFVKTLVFKGAADYVLYPEVDFCVSWPWEKFGQTEEELKNGKILVSSRDILKKANIP